MRLRNVTGSMEMIAESQYVVHNPEQFRGKWNTLFENKNQIHIEIGMGKGKFLTKLAFVNPNINYLGIEKYSSVLLRAIEKQQELNCPNLWFIRFDAQNICSLFDTDEISRIYLNFSDPWPKDRHAARRLTSTSYLSRYIKFLRSDGNLEFKTDNRSLFDFSIQQVQEASWQLREITYDLHRSEYAKSNIMTEYEEKFSSLGNPIHRLAAFP